MKIVITGAGGLLGWHTAARLHAQNCAARFRREPEPHDIVALDRAAFNDSAQLRAALNGAAAVLHFAGVNRGDPAAVEAGNPAIATTLMNACQNSGCDAHIVYANSTHAALDTPYGRGKARAADILSAAPNFTDLVLPHIFGECARPDYNNVTATFIARTLEGSAPQVNPDGVVHLLHAGDAAQTAIDAAFSGTTGQIRPDGRDVPVPDLRDRLQSYHDAYGANRFPDLADPFDVALFNSYRAALYPGGFPRALPLNTDPRGTLFEAVKGGAAGQTFLSWTKPGITRGDHFHLTKVERFLVLQGQATIRIRRVLDTPVWEYNVSGDTPEVVDMPTLHTHSIENTGDTPLLTLFWTHEIFDPAAPDTYFDPALDPVLT